MENIFIWIPIVIFVIYVTYIFLQSLYKREASTAVAVAKGSNDYAGIVILFTILGTMIGPGYSYGAIEEFYKYGFFYTVFFILAVVQFWLFGHIFAGKIKNISSDCETAGDILGKAYGKPMQIITGFLTVAFSIAIVGALGLAGGKVLASVTDIDENLAIVLALAFVVIYSFWGGIATVIKTDKPQFLFICAFAIIGLIAAVYQYFSNGASVDISGYIFNSNQTSTMQIVNWGFAFFLGEAFLPVYSIRGIIAKDSTTAKKAFKRAAYIGFVWFIVLTVIGIGGHYVDCDNEKLVYLNLIQSTFHGPWGALLTGLALAGMLSVVMSTIDSLLNSAGVSFRKDIMQQIFKSITPEQQLAYTRYAILLVAVCGLFVASVSNGNIVNLLLYAYALWVPAIVFPFAYYLLKNKVNNKNSGLYGAITGFLGWCVFNLTSAPVSPILMGLIFNVITVLLIEKYANRDNGTV
jgi:SSS family solute:Na+ symporter